MKILLEIKKTFKMLLKKLYPYLPSFVHNLFISGYNILANRIRYAGNYKKYKKFFNANKNISLEELNKIQFKKLLELLKFSSIHSAFYKELYKNIDFDKFSSVNDLNQLPIIDKETIRVNIQKVLTVDKKQGVVSKTGGTTGKSLEVIFTKDNIHERFALMDNFRSQFGYELGKKTAWFSGKSLLTNHDVKRNRFWKTDYWYNVRYYSTFHIKEDYLKFYIGNLIKFKPEFIIGFPTSLDEVAKYGKKNNIQFPENMIKAIFTTSETVTEEIRKNIEEFFKANLYNQYSASEGAPIITECLNHRLHLELQSGVFEVLNESNLPSNNGRLVVTSFTTYGTPLIRYDIGDIVELSDEKCSCGNHNPLVKQILGRIDDYVYSPENGKINLTNIANAIKDIKGIVKMQIIQDLINEINIKLVIEEDIYKKESENHLFSNLRDRLGNEISIKLEYVKDILVEKSGKYRVVKNNIKHLIEK